MTIPICGPRPRMIKIKTHSGKVYWSQIYFYHCVLAYARGLETSDIADTWANGSWRGIGCLEDVAKLRSYHQERDGINTKTGFLKLFKGKL